MKIFKKICYLFLAFIIFGSDLFAQRSTGYTGKDSTLKVNTLSGFPGMFDTNLPSKYSLVIASPTILSGNNTINAESSTTYLPYVNVDFGVNESFSVGTNLITYIPFFAGGAGGSLKARTKIFENKVFQDVITSYAGGGFFSGDDELNYSFNYFILTNGAKFNLTPRSSLTVFAHFWSVYFAAIHDTIEENYEESQFTIDLLSSFVGVNYHLFFQHVGFSAAVVIPFYVDYSQDTLTYRLAKNVTGFDKSFVTVRSGLDIRFGSHGLLSVGMSYMEFSQQILNQSVLLWGSYSHRLSF